MTSPPAPVVRAAKLNDAEAIRAIYNHEVTSELTVFDLVPRTLEEQRRWLTERSGAHAVLVAEHAGEIVGFGSLSPYRERPAYRTTIEDSVYVARTHHGQGIGSLLLTELVAVVIRHGFHTMVARIAGGNAASVTVHERAGFEQVGIEREVGRKFGRWLDVVIMQRML